MKSYLQLHTLLLKRIKTLLTEKIFHSRDEYRESLAAVIMDFFPMLKWLSEVVGSREDIQELFATFRRLYRVNGPETIGNVEFSPSQIEDFEDEINYLKICVANICNVDLDDLDPNLLVAGGESEGDRMENEAARAMDLEYFPENMDDSAFPTITPKVLLDQLRANVRATNRLHSKILSWEVYIYKTKPKRNLVMKAVLMILWYVGFVASLLALGNNIKYGMEKNALGSLDWNLILLSTFFYIVLSLSNFLHLLLNMNNHNRRYHFCGRTCRALLASLITFVFVLSLSKLILYPSPNFLRDGESTAIWNTVFWTTSVATLLHLLSCIFLQPEEDRDVMERFIKEYVSDSSDSLPQDL